MTMATLFSAMSLLVAPLWLAMFLAPRARLTARLLGSPLVLLPICLVYVALVLPDIVAIFPVVARPELGTIAPLLGSERGATIAWAHFLAFDVFVGRWVWQDALGRGVPSLVLVPVLFTVLMLGPLGLTIHLAVRGTMSRTQA